LTKETKSITFVAKKTRPGGGGMNGVVENSGLVRSPDKRVGTNEKRAKKESRLCSGSGRVEGDKFAIS